MEEQKMFEQLEVLGELAKDNRKMNIAQRLDLMKCLIDHDLIRRGIPVNEVVDKKTGIATNLIDYELANASNSTLFNNLVSLIERDVTEDS